MQADTKGNAKPAAEMTPSEVLGNRSWPAHFTTDQMRAQIEWEQHPDFARVTAEYRKMDEARLAASYQGWLDEQEAKKEKDPYKAAASREKEIKQMGRRYYGRKGR